MEQQSKNIIRVEKNQDYTVINNTSLYDERLSWKAKAIHVYMLSKPDNWVFYNEEMVKWAKDGVGSFASGLKELTQLGYVKKEKRRGSNGKFEWVTVVYEVPKELAAPYPEKPCMENPPMEAQAAEQQVNNPPYPEKPYMEKPPMEKPCMENPSVEKPFVENPQLLSTNTPSTDSLSTDTPNIDSLNTTTKKVVVEEQATPANQNPFHFYAQNGFGLTMNDITRQKIMHWCEDLSDELVVYAMQISMERNCISWSYAEGILKKWAAKHVKSIEDVEALLAQHKAQQQQRHSKQPFNKRDEQLPDWFHKRNNASPVPEAAPNELPQEPIDFEAERLKVLAKLEASKAK